MSENIDKDILDQLAAKDGRIVALELSLKGANECVRIRDSQFVALNQKMEIWDAELVKTKNELIDAKGELAQVRAERDRYKEALERIKKGGDYAWVVADRALRAEEEKGKGTISDGMGSTWSKTCAECGKDTMEVVRPGKVQCSRCG